MSICCCCCDFVDLSGVCTTDIREELAKRIRSGQASEVLDPDHIEPWTTNGLADDLREAFYRRDASRLESLLAVLDRNRGPFTRVNQGRQHHA